MNNNERQIAYFSMEIGLDADVPTYCRRIGTCWPATRFARQPTWACRWWP